VTRGVNTGDVVLDVGGNAVANVAAGCADVRLQLGRRDDPVEL